MNAIVAPPPRFLRHFAAGLVMFCLCAPLGCRSFEAAAPPPSLADEDATLKQPLRPRVGRERQWWELPNFFDERSQQIERNLGY